MDIKAIRLANLRELVSRFDSKRAFADRAAISEGYLYQVDSPAPSRSLGHATARRIEKNLGLAPGWMDTPHEGASVTASPLFESKRVRLVSLEELRKGSEPSGRESVTTDQSVGPRGFAFRVEDGSMSPDFSIGDLVIVDPDLRPRPGDMVIARIRTQDETLAVFRKFRARPGGCELVPSNDDFAVHAGGPDEIEIVGTMIEHRRYRRP